jgi:hypothetical protein
MAAREAGNIIYLDSDPTKLIEVVLKPVYQKRFANPPSATRIEAIDNKDSPA